MSCPHPASALFVDKQRGATICTLCNDIVVDQQFELDPVFSRGTRAGAGGTRGGGGAFRPTHTTTTVSAPSARPSVEVARRDMLAIARALEIGPNIVECAVGLYKLALGVNAISGSRSVILCACLYAMCRRERTSHVIYDFAQVHKDSPHAILAQMKHICESTHTEVPVVDPSCLVQRFAELMDLGDRTADVVVCALKVLRAMKDDWIACGRRPMGVCAAALLVACCVFGIQRSPEQVCGLVRLTADTITRRLNEFAATPTAALEDIDTYQPTNTTLPPAFNESSRKATEEDVNASMRDLSALYYELVAEAKISTPPTPERCERWRRFILCHCSLEGITPTEDNLNLVTLTAEAQLKILGLENTVPIPYEMAEYSVKREEVRLLVKREEGSQSHLSQEGGGAAAADPSTLLMYGGKAVRELQPGTTFSLAAELKYGSSVVSTSTAAAAAKHPALQGLPADGPIDYEHPDQLRMLTDCFCDIVTNSEEVIRLRNDFDAVVDCDGAQGVSLFGEATQNTYGGAGAYSQNVDPSPQPCKTEGGIGFDEETARMRMAVNELLRDRERRHALPWEFMVLQNAERDDVMDLKQYLVLDNEERERRQKVGKALYMERWARGRARTAEEIEALELGRTAKKRRRGVITEATSVSAALDRALRGRGASAVDISAIDDLIPGLHGGGHDEAGAYDDEWNC